MSIVRDFTAHSCTHRQISQVLQSLLFLPRTQPQGKPAAVGVSDAISRVAAKVFRHESLVIAILNQPDALPAAATGAAAPAGNTSAPSLGSFASVLDNAQSASQGTDNPPNEISMVEWENPTATKKHEDKDSNDPIQPIPEEDPARSCAAQLLQICVPIPSVPTATNLIPVSSSEGTGDASVPIVAEQTSSCAGSASVLPAAAPPAAASGGVAVAADAPPSQPMESGQVADGEKPAGSANPPSPQAPGRKSAELIDSDTSPSPASKNDGELTDSRATSPQDRQSVSSVTTPATTVEPPPAITEPSEGKPDRVPAVGSGRARKFAAPVSTEASPSGTMTGNGSKSVVHAASQATSKPVAGSTKAVSTRGQPPDGTPPQAAEQAPVQTSPTDADRTPPLPESKASASNAPADASSIRTAVEPQPDHAPATHDVLNSATPIFRTSSEPANSSAPPEAADPAPRTAEITPQISPTAGVNVARMVEHFGQSEMHIGLRTAAFGSVEVHTVIRDNQVGLAVGTEKGDLKSLLTAEVPNLRAALHHQDLQFEGIRFLGNSAGVETNLGNGSHPDSRPFRQALPVQSREPTTEDSLPSLTELAATSHLHPGLNVHA